MDAISDPTVHTVVALKASQVGWTDILCNVAGYHIDQDPAPILLIQPTLEMGHAWSKDRLSPMLRDTPVLRGAVSDAKSRDSDNTILHKVFEGGHLTIVGANSPAGLASRPIRVVLCDETDRWPASAGTEGDPLKLAAKRQITFWNRKTLLGSTPVRKEASVIYREWLRSDQRKYYVPCPDCGEHQVMHWAQVRWDKEESDGQVFHLPSTAHYVCEHCGSLWDDVVRWQSVARGEWRATAEFHGVAGFHITGFMSPWMSLEEIVQEFLDARGSPELLQVWTNTVLGEPWEEAGESVDQATLANRGEPYRPDFLPDAIRVVVAGVDVQGDRLEAGLYGFGYKEETWAIRHEVLHGDPAQGQVWEELDELLKEVLVTETGRRMMVRAACIDTGGHHAAQVHAFCRTKVSRKIWAVKGAQGPRPIWPKRASKTNDKKDTVFILGVDTAKDAIYGRLKISVPGPGYCHFPVGEGFDSAFFDQLTAERVLTRYKLGKPYRVWDCPKGKRNEALDIFVYALAARHSLPGRLDVPIVSQAPAADDRRRPATERTEAGSADGPRVEAAPRPMMHTVPPRRGRTIRRSAWMS